MKRKIVLALLLLLAVLRLPAQIEKMRDLLDDEMDTENYTLRFLNALDGNPVQDANVEITDIGSFTTDVQGKIKFPRNFEDGWLEVKVTATGYIPVLLPVEVIAGTIFNNRISLSPVMAIEWLRIVLDWGRSPKDLDAHFEKSGQYHVSYRNMKVAQDGVCRLDRDDTQGFGPETITAEIIESDATYEYRVHDYTNQANENSRHLSGSGATVKVYGNGQLLRHFTVPADKRGNVWKVFEIRNGEIIPIQ